MRDVKFLSLVTFLPSLKISNGFFLVESEINNFIINSNNNFKIIIRINDKIIIRIKTYSFNQSL